MRNHGRLALFIALALALSLGVCHGQSQIRQRQLYQRRQEQSGGSEDIDTPVLLGPFPLRRYRHLMRKDFYNKRAEPSESSQAEPTESSQPAGGGHDHTIESTFLKTLATTAGITTTTTTTTTSTLTTSATTTATHSSITEKTAPSSIHTEPTYSAPSSKRTDPIAPTHSAPSSILPEPTHSDPPPLTDKPSTTDASSAGEPTKTEQEKTTSAATSSREEITTTTTRATTTTETSATVPVTTTTTTTTTIEIPTTTTTTTTAITTTTTTTIITTTATTTTTTTRSEPIVSHHTSHNPIRTSSSVSKPDPTTEATPSSSSSSDIVHPSDGSSVGGTNKTGITIGFTVGSIVVAAGIGVWIFRKWKLSPSRQFKSKIRSSVGGSIGPSRADDDPEDYEMYSDLFRPPVHDSGFPGVAAASSMAGSSPTIQHMHYEQQPYEEHDQHMAGSQLQQPRTNLSANSTVPDYGQYRQQGQERWVDDGYGYDAVVNEAIIGSSEGAYHPATYANQDNGAPDHHFLRELRE